MLTSYVCIIRGYSSHRADRLVMQEFKSCNKFCHGSLVDQIRRRSGKNMGGKR